MLPSGLSDDELRHAYAVFDRGHDVLRTAFLDAVQRGDYARHARPFGRAALAVRLLAAGTSVAVGAWFIIAGWRAVPPLPESRQPAGEGTSSRKETIVAGPADEDPTEWEQAKDAFDAVVDKNPVVATDMPTYWRLMKWTRSLSFADMEQRAKRNVPFSDLFMEPDKHRGELIRLRLHVRRVTAGDAPENSAGIKTMYDVWGTTDESRSNFYAVVCAELPPEIPVADDARWEVVFVGYFLKVMAYVSGDGKERGAPLLIGRMKPIGE